MNSRALLELKGIRKVYPSVVANDAINLTVHAGEIHAILGENGAGKSTLMKIIYGAIQPDAGEIRWEGQPMGSHTPARARALGIGMVFQHFSLFESLTVLQNIALGVPQSLAKLTASLEKLSARYRLPIDPHQLVHALSMGERQRVEILRALLQAPKLLILDEPTSVLAPQAIEALFQTLRQLSAEGCGVLYISHKLDEIQRLCHRATVLRAGKVVDSIDPRQASAQMLARMMIGHEVESTSRPAQHASHEVALRVEQLSVEGVEGRLQDVSFQVNAGEIVGIAGVSGNGQRALLSALSGEAPVREARSVHLLSHAVGQLKAGARRALGLCYVPEERVGRGAVPSLTLAENGLLTAHTPPMVHNGLVRLAAVRQFARRCIETMKVKARDEMVLAGSLSGGNLQKFIIARELLQTPRVLIVAQPTWGVDVGAATELRQRLIDLRDAGVAILVISEDLEELFEISDRIGVLFEGRLSVVVPLLDTTPQEIGTWMAGMFSKPRSVQHASA